MNTNFLILFGETLRPEFKTLTINLTIFGKKQIKY